MTERATVLVEVVEALRDGITAALPGGVTLAMGWPGPNETPRMVSIGDARWNEHRLAAIGKSATGRVKRHEEVDQDVTVWFYDGTLAPGQAHTLRVAAFRDGYTPIADYLAANPTLGLPCVQLAVLKPREVVLVNNPKYGDRTLAGWACQITAAVEVTARLA